jgi:DNA mismatch endonuclease, patch repair protein
MVDIFGKKKRSEIMSKIKAKGNVSTEITLARLLRKEKLSGWRRHNNKVYGNPDFSWQRLKIAIFVDGCFWHGCPRCSNLKPKQNRQFWKKKIGGNIKRDELVTKTLKSKGWKVIRIWEHDIERKPQTVINCILKVFTKTGFPFSRE